VGSFVDGDPIIDVRRPASLVESEAVQGRGVLEPEPRNTGKVELELTADPDLARHPAAATDVLETLTVPQIPDQVETGGGIDAKIQPRPLIRRIANIEQAGEQGAGFAPRDDR